MALFAARDIRARMAAEILEGRLSAGLSQREAAAAVGMSRSELGRIERGEIARPTIEQISRACTAVGLRLVARAYPAGDPVRDRTQLALLARLRATLAVGVDWRSEVPLPLPGDLRAWDAVMTFRDGVVAVEAESRLRDVQALERRISLKQRDGRIDRIVLLLNDTEANRRALVGARDALRQRFPLDGRDLLRALRSGRAPDGSGIVLM